MKPKLCKHRHDSTSHPNCFNKQFYELEEGKLGYLDIETTGLNANNDWMLSWAIKTRGYNEAGYNFVTPEDMFVRSGKVNREYDKRIVKNLIEVIAQHKTLVTYYGTGFDIGFMRTRAMILGLKFPKVKTINHIDLYYHVRNKMSLDRNSLAQATKCLNIDGKTRLDFSYWKLAGMGDQEAMKELIHHNVEDVKILESLHKELEPYCRFNRNSI